MLKNYKNTVIAIMLACILTMSIGYAILSQRLDIRGTSNISSVWDVQITGINSTATGGASDRVAPSYTATTATFSTNLVNPGDTMTYDVTVENRGTLDAVLKLVTLSQNNNLAINFDYRGIKEGDILKAGESVHVYVTVKYNDVTSQPQNTSANYTITLDYVQNTDDVIVVPNSSYLAYTAYGIDTYDNWLNGPILREDIESISFTTTNVVPTTVGTNYFDASSQQDGSIMAWYYDEDNDGLYEFIIGQEGGVVANPDSTDLFSELTNLTTIDITYLDTSNVTNMSYMFAYNPSLTSLDLRGLDTSSVVNMANMFEESDGLIYLDVSTWNTSNVSDMSSMFSECNALKELNLSNWNTSSVTNMGNMFFSCFDLIKLDISGFDTSNVTIMNGMFNVCESLESLDLSHFDTSKIANMANVFASCRSLKELNLTGWDTSNVTNMYMMFLSCNSLKTLDLSSFDTSKVTNMYYMFNCFTGTSQLETIYVSELWDTSSLNESAGMFSNCKSLVGAIPYDSNVRDATHANYETGYLTYKAAPTV